MIAEHVTLRGAVCGLLAALVLAGVGRTFGADRLAVEGVAVPLSAGHYTLWNLTRLTTVAVLRDNAGVVGGQVQLPSRFLCSETGTYSNGLPVLLTHSAMPSSDSIPPVRNFFAQGSDVFSGEGHTVVGSDTHSDPDMDGDRVPSWYESAHGSNPAAANAGEDADGDGHSLFEEYIAGTDPQDEQSVLRLSAIQAPLPGGQVSLAWTSVAGRKYEVQFGPGVAGAYAAVGSLTATGAASALQGPAPTGLSVFRVSVRP